MIECHVCGKPATCIGVYEGLECGPLPACDDCCGHGNEDGSCDPLPAARPSDDQGGRGMSERQPIERDEDGHCRRCGLEWPDEVETLETHVCPPGFLTPDRAATPPQEADEPDLDRACGNAAERLQELRRRKGARERRLEEALRGAPEMPKVGTHREVQGFLVAYSVWLAAARSALGETPALDKPLRCYVTGNLSGTDSWPKGYACACRGCITYMARLVGLEPALGETPQEPKE